MKLRQILLLLSTILTTAATHASITDYSLQPSTGGAVSSLATVKITFPEAKFLGMYGSTLTGVTLTSNADPSVVYEPCNITYSTFFSSNSQTFSLRKVGDSAASVVSEPGEYQLHFPAGCFDLCGDWYEHLAYSTEIDVTYTVGESGAGYDRYFDPAAITVRPVPGSLMEFKDVTLCFPVTAEHPTIDIIDTDVITMTRAGADAPEYVIADTYFDGEGTASINFRRAASGYPHPEYIYEPGEYTINIPAGIFRLTSTDIVNDAMTIKYTVTGTNAASESLKDYTLTPAPGTIDRIESIILRYPDLDGELSFPDGTTDITPYVTGRITLKRLNTDPDLCSVYEPYSATLLGNNAIELRFKNRVSSGSISHAETITRMGDYQLTVLPNTFKLKSNTFAFNARIEAYYTIDRDMPSNTMATYTLSPADGEELGSITTHTITFPEATEGLVYPVNRTLITLTNIDDPTDVYQARGLMLQANKLTWGWNRPDHSYDDKLTITREGTYRLDIQAGAMRDYDNPTNANPAITAQFHISPDNVFGYSLSPEPDRAYTELSTIRISGDGSGLRPTGAVTDPVTLREASGTNYRLSCDDRCVFELPAALPDGNYTLTIPEGYFVQTNSRGREVYNKRITAAYRLTRPAHFDATVIPAPGSVVSGLTSISVTPAGSTLRSFGVDTGAGAATLTGDGVSLTLQPTVSQYAVSFILPDDTRLAAGRYTFAIPSGYITVVDGNGLTTSLDAVTAVYTVRQGTTPAFAGGMFVLNEGAYGSAFGSLNYLESDLATMHYRVFSGANGGKTPGVTTQYGTIHGNRLYLMSKQASYSIPASLLTVADSRTLAIEHQITLVGVSGRAVCPIDSHKAYIGTSDGIYVYDADNGRLGTCIEGTATASGKYDDQTGDMLRMGRYVFAAVQGAGVHVVDPASDQLVQTIALPQVSGLFVTGEGHLYASADDETAPFVEIDPERLVTTPVATRAAPVASQWDSWRALPLTAAIRGNRIFYITQPGTRSIASYDFDSDVFKADYITLPSHDGVDMKTYGTTVSTEPLTGYVVITANGGAGKYDCNCICYASPVDGHIIEPMTIGIEKDFWFPAMTFTPADITPEISAGHSLSLAAATETHLDVAAITYLSSGNPHMMVYSAESSAPEVCTVTREREGIYVVSGIAPGTADISVTADYRGTIARAAVRVTVYDEAGIGDIQATEAPMDVYDLSGRMILHQASPAEIRRLPRGVYIINGNKKLII